VNARSPDANFLNVAGNNCVGARHRRRRFARVRRELPYGFRRHMYKPKIVHPTASRGKLLKRRPKAARSCVFCVLAAFAIVR
jgi:hypothetical protein